MKTTVLCASCACLETERVVAQALVPGAGVGPAAVGANVAVAAVAAAAGPPEAVQAPRTDLQLEGARAAGPISMARALNPFSAHVVLGCPATKRFVLFCVFFFFLSRFFPRKLNRAGGSAPAQIAHRRLGAINACLPEQRELQQVLHSDSAQHFADTVRLGAREQAHEGHPVREPPATDLEAEDKQAAAPAPEEGKCGGACGVESGAGLGRSAVSSDGADKGGVHSDPHTAPGGQGMGHNLRAAVIQHRRIEVEVAQEHVLGHTGASLAADPGGPPRHPARPDRGIPAR